MIKFTKFDPLSGKIISQTSCSNEEDVWVQMRDGQGFVMGWRDSNWTSNADEGFVRDGEDFVRTREWLDKYWPIDE